MHDMEITGYYKMFTLFLQSNLCQPGIYRVNSEAVGKIDLRI
jgi:hypothetical protein